MSIEKIKLLTCDWCNEQGHFRPTKRDKAIRNFMQGEGWISVVHGSDGVLDFCGEECKELYYKDEIGIKKD